MATNAVKVRGANVARQVWANKSVIVANIRGNTTVKCNTMRAVLGESKASMKFMKNSMAVAGLDATPERAQLANLLHGQVVFLSSNELDLFKVACKLDADYEEFSIIGGAYENTLLTREGIFKTAELGGLDQVRGRLVGALVGTNYKLVQTLGAPQLSAARVLAARKDQLGKPAPEAPTE